MITILTSCAKEVPTPDYDAQGEPVLLTQNLENTIDGDIPPLTTNSKNQSAFYEQSQYDEYGIEPVRVALLLPMTGQYADLGTKLYDAAQLALFDIGKPNIELLPIDTKGTVIGATRAAKEAISKNVHLILGPIFSESTRAVAPLGYKHDVNIVSFSNDTSLAGEGVFMLGFSPEQQMKRVINYALTNEVTLFADIVPNNSYGAMISRLLREQVDNESQFVVKSEFYLPQRSNIVRNIQRAVNSLIRSNLEKYQRLKNGKDEEAVNNTEPTNNNTNIDTANELPLFNDLKALIVPEGGKRLEIIAKTLERYHLKDRNIRILGSGQWDGSNISTIPVLQGSWYASAEPQRRIRFEEHFESVYGYKPIRLSSLAYDGVALAATLANMPGGADFSYRAITTKRGFIGIDGIFRLLENGITERGLAVIEITENGRSVIDPAPKSFHDINFSW